jgi:hypothetical protein
VSIYYLVTYRADFPLAENGDHMYIYWPTGQIFRWRGTETWRYSVCVYLLTYRADFPLAGNGDHMYIYWPTGQIFRWRGTETWRGICWGTCWHTSRGTWVQLCAGVCEQDCLGTCRGTLWHFCFGTCMHVPTKLVSEQYREIYEIRANVRRNSWQTLEIHIF